MKTISFKGLSVGIFVAIALSFLLGLLSMYYFSALFSELVPGVNFAKEAEVQKFMTRFLYHPLTIAFGVFATLITVGIPSYVAAFVAGRAFIFHSLAIGCIFSLMFLTEWELLVQFPVLFGVIVGFTMLVAFGAGYLRQRQVAERAK